LVNMTKDEILIKNLTGNDSLSVEIFGEDIVFDNELRKNL